MINTDPKKEDTAMNNGKISNARQLCSLTHYRVEGGAMQDLHVTDCTNGRLRFLLNDSKALDVMQVYFEGENASFISKNGFVARELPFLRRFEGGMVYTCGLDAVGGVEGYELHGSLHCTPANVTRREITADGILIEGEVRHTALFGQNLVLRRSFYSAAGSDSLEIRDTLVNEGDHDAEYALLYHINLGYPLLDEGGYVEANAASITPRNEWAAQHAEDWSKFGEPKKGYEEMCYFLTMNEGRIAYANEAAGKRLTLEYDKTTLPCFVLWKSECHGDYAMGLEPATTELDDRFARRSIAPGEQIEFRAKLTFSKI
jgi:hypothetical protein